MSMEINLTHLLDLKDNNVAVWWVTLDVNKKIQQDCLRYKQKKPLILADQLPASDPLKLVSPSWWWPPCRRAPVCVSPSCLWSPAPSWSSPSPGRSTAPPRWSEPAAQSPPWSSWPPAGSSGNPCAGRSERTVISISINFLFACSWLTRDSIVFFRFHLLVFFCVFYVVRNKSEVMFVLQHLLL